ncbi:30S ribosomal protein S5 [Ditylenchus destructor]|uniref:Small ribosomal subunit protein uS5m n=1 Tax=Ditylenchus destructor TaxID=166010 RepID=A0AAD4NBN4_9BILA|nr:30S ribosomal protein S5 [Ditylenchus destructor]
MSYSKLLVAHFRKALNISQCSAATNFSQIRTKVDFFQRRTQDELWKTVTNVSPAGSRKGTRKSRQRIKKLEKFYNIGRDSPMKITFPGLEGKIDQPEEPIKVEVEEGEEVKMPQEVIRETVATMPKKGYRPPSEKLHQLERGFVSQSILGQKLGPPPSDHEGNFDDFQTYCLWVRRTCRMTPMYGRTFRMQAFSITGNGKGIAGFGAGHAGQFKTNEAIIKSIRNASKRLFHVNLLENRTLYQDFFAECRNVRVFAQRVPEGYGIVAHPRLHKLCELLGIKDIHVKTEGTTRNYKGLIYAFTTGLMNQENHQELAERRGLHVVELKASRQWFPKVIASPKFAPMKTMDEITPLDQMKMDEFYGEGRMPLDVPKRRPWYSGNARNVYAAWRKHPYRNMENVMKRIMADDIVPRWTRMERKGVAEREHQMVLSGEKPVPMGIGLSDISERRNTNFEFKDEYE